MLKFSFNIQTVAQMVVAGITTAQTIIEAVQAGRAAIREASSETLVPVNELPARLDVAIAEAKAIASLLGAETAQRIEDRARAPEGLEG